MLARIRPISQLNFTISALACLALNLAGCKNSGDTGGTITTATANATVTVAPHARSRSSGVSTPAGGACVSATR
jgi:hypothetical protein